MAKQGQHPAADRVSEAEWEALDNFRRDLSHARADLDALTHDARATMAEVTEVLRPITPLTTAARGLSLAVERLEDQLRAFAHRGTPVYLGPPPAPLGDRLIVALFFLLGLCGVGWMLFGPDLDPPRSTLSRSYDPTDLAPVPPPRRIVPAPPPMPALPPGE